jgi:hypothetical protein
MLLISFRGKEAIARGDRLREKLATGGHRGSEEEQPGLIE